MDRSMDREEGEMEGMIDWTCTDGRTDEWMGILIDGWVNARFWMDWWVSISVQWVDGVKEYRGEGWLKERLKLAEYRMDRHNPTLQVFVDPHLTPYLILLNLSRFIADINVVVIIIIIIIIIIVVVIVIIIIIIIIIIIVVVVVIVIIITSAISFPSSSWLIVPSNQEEVFFLLYFFFFFFSPTSSFINLIGCRRLAVSPLTSLAEDDDDDDGDGDDDDDDDDGDGDDDDDGDGGGVKHPAKYGSTPSIILSDSRTRISGCLRAPESAKQREQCAKFLMSFPGNR